MKDEGNDILYLTKVNKITDIQDIIAIKPTTKAIAYEGIRGTYRLTELTIDGQATDAIVMNFTPSEDIQSITVAKDFGIIAYTDKQGNLWNKE